MIPIKIKMDRLNVNDIEELEYKYLTEIPRNIIDKFDHYGNTYNDNEADNNKLLSLFTNNRFSIYRYLGTVGESNLFTSYGKLYTSDKEVDFIYYDRGYGDMGFLLTDDVLKDMVGKRFDCDYIGHGYLKELFKEYIDKEIGIGDFIQKFIGLGIKAENQKIKEEKEREKELELKIIGNEKENSKFDEGIWNEGNSINGIGNTIYYYRNEYTFEKDINELFTLEELNTAMSKYSFYGIAKLNWIESLSIKKGISYNFISQDKKRKYSLKFKNDKMYVDSVLVPKARSSFFVSRANGDTENLKKFKELSAIKVEFLALKNITINAGYTYNIPIEIEYEDKLFNVTLLDKTIKVDWKDLELFKYSTQSLRSNFYSNNMKNLMELFGIVKSDMLDYMKKIQLLDKLGEED